MWPFGPRGVNRLFECRFPSRAGCSVACDVLSTRDALAERSKAVAQGAIPKGRGFEPHRRHFCLLHQRNLTSRMGDRWGITERSHCLRGLMTSAQGARCPGFNAQRKPLFLTLSCLILFLGADHSEPPCRRSDKRWVVAICLA